MHSALHKNTTIGQANKVSKSWWKIFICASSCLSVTLSLFPMNIKRHFLTSPLHVLQNLLAFYFFWAPTGFWVSLHYALVQVVHPPAKLREREQTSRFWGRRWRKIALPSLASMKIIYNTNPVLSCWFSSLQTFVSMLQKYLSLLSAFPKLNIEQISKITLLS